MLLPGSYERPNHAANRPQAPSPTADRSDHAIKSAKPEALRFVVISLPLVASRAHNSMRNVST
jgi:hypothetical protein